MRISLVLLATVALAACNKAPSTDEIDNELVANAIDDSDPALTSALEDQIMVDPKLAGQANSKTVKPAPAPPSAPVPPGEDGKEPSPAGKPGDAPLGSIATVRTGDCRDVRYDLGWAQRLPAAFPLPPGAKVTEAAGSDRNGCTLRVVGFTMPGTVDGLFGFYEARAKAAGYTIGREAEGGDRLLGGTRGDAAYSVIARPAKGGVSAELLVNGGR